MNPELKKEFHQNARALAICGVLLILLSFVPWVERSQEIGTEGPLVYTAHLPSRVREFMQSDDFVAGSKTTTQIRGYQLKGTFALGDGVILAGAGALVALLGFLCRYRAPDRRSAIAGIALASVLLAVAVAAVLPNWQQEGAWHGEASTYFKVFWDPTFGVWLASLVLLFAGWKLVNLLVISLMRANA